MNQSKYIYILNANGEPLMPTARLGKVRHWLQSGEAHWFGNSRTTIQFSRPVGHITQPCIEGVDTGDHLGISVINQTTNTELYSSVSYRNRDREVKRNNARRMYRHARRGRLRHRQARFDNRRKPQGWLAPSIRHQIKFIVDEITRLEQFLPITEYHIETAIFDIAKLTNYGARPRDYTKGAKYGFNSVKEYLYHRQHGIDPVDHKHYPISRMVVHHLIPRHEGGTNMPSNLVLLAPQNHTGANHNNGVLTNLAQQRQLGIDSRGAFMMNVFSARLPRLLAGKKICYIYGYETAEKRRQYGFTKQHSDVTNHALDAMIIAGGNQSTRLLPQLIYREKRHRNNRSLEKFYDAKYRSLADGKIHSGKELGSTRVTRAKHSNDNQLRKLRANKVKSGHRSIRRHHYQFQPNDLVQINNHMYYCNGCYNKGKILRVTIDNNIKGLSIKKHKPRLVHHSNSVKIIVLNH